MLVPLVEYAKTHGKAQVTVRQMAARGGFKTAQKIGKNWVIDSDEPYPEDRKISSGKYINYRRNKKRDCQSSGAT
ncbi:MAG: hypothetical protein IJ523_08865 [Succinivibrionaceae bacterium]|nr:hypothetical protein [Succinivibrionaceae bacterium]